MTDKKAGSVYGEWKRILIDLNVNLDQSSNKILMKTNEYVSCEDRSILRIDIARGRMKNSEKIVKY